MTVNIQAVFEKKRETEHAQAVERVASGTASCGVWRSIKWHHQTPQSSGKKEGKPSVYYKGSCAVGVFHAR